MPRDQSDLYQNPVEVWDEKKCQRVAKKLVKDGMGAPHPRRGYIGTDYGPVRYNGGCCKKGKWYPGETRPLPCVPESYKIIHVSTWGFYLVPATDPRPQWRPPGETMPGFHRIDGGGSVEHLTRRDDVREGYSLCGSRSVVGGWVSRAHENITKADEVPLGTCKRCVKIAFPSV